MQKFDCIFRARLILVALPCMTLADRNKILAYTADTSANIVPSKNLIKLLIFNQLDRFICVLCGARQIDSITKATFSGVR